MIDTYYQDKNNNFTHGHSTTLIVDNKNKSLFYFNPNGFNKKSQAEKAVFKFIDHSVLPILPGYSISNIQRMCPRIGPQELSANGDEYCVTWSVMFFHLFVLNPGVNPNTIQVKMSQGLSPTQILHMIKRYTRLMDTSIPMKLTPRWLKKYDILDP
jgi:hypothetical protein